MKRYFVAALLAACLLLPALSGEARAAETNEYTLYFRDVDGGLRKLPCDGNVYVNQGNPLTSGVQPRPLKNGVFTVSEGDGKYNLYVSGWGRDSCYSGQGTSYGGTAEIEIKDGKPVEPMVVSLSVDVYTEVYGPTSNTEKSRLGEVRWTLTRGNETVSSGTTNAVAGSSGSSTDYLHLTWERHALRLEKTGYQTVVYPLTPVMLENGTVIIEGLDMLNLRMLPDGLFTQPMPTDARYANGVVSYVPRFTTANGQPESIGTIRQYWLEVKNEETGETKSESGQYFLNTPGAVFTYDLFTRLPSLESGYYTVEIRTPAWPYAFPMLDSESVFLRFYYRKPSRLPDVENPRWKEDKAFTVAWDYPLAQYPDVDYFRVFPMVADAPDAEPRDFAHQYLEDWEGSIKVFPSLTGEYSPAALVRAMYEHGEGWYYFTVSAVAYSDSEDWRSGKSSGLIGPFHYVPDSTGPVKSGTVSALSGGGAVNWTLDILSGALSVSTAPQEQGLVYVASYRANGQFLGIQDARQNAALNLTGADSARMFWMEDGTFRPKAGASQVT